MEALKAIDTKYRNHLFRSRLEARWAIFFDAMGIDWRYEHEGYDLDGLYYLPDFWLPTFDGGIFVEVKPIEFNENELLKARQLVLKSGYPLWMAIGLPDFKVYEYIALEYGNDKETVIWDCIPNFSKAHNQNRMYVSLSGEQFDMSNFSPMYFNAVEASNSARFDKK